MAIVTIPGGLWIPNSMLSLGAEPSFASAGTISSGIIFAAAIVQVPKAGTLDQFEVRQQSNGTPPTNGIRFSFQDVTATGDPDNTDDQFRDVLAGFGSGVWLAPPGPITSDGTDTGVKRIVTRGEYLACVIKLPSFVAGNVAFSVVNVASSTENVQNTRLNNYWATTANSGGTWTKVTATGINIALKYDDGSYATFPAPIFGFLLGVVNTYNTGSTPDERGLLFQVPFPCRLSGIWVKVDADNPFDIVIYDAASSVVTSFSGNAGIRATTGARNAYYLLPTPLTLTPNVNYRVTLLPSTGSSISTYDWTFSTSAIRAAQDGMSSTWMLTTRTDAGGWTDTDTARPVMGLVLDGFDSGGGGGGGGEHSSVF